jgi:tripartite-type tricarboxylate transporter receptor subunit TctC
MCFSSQRAVLFSAAVLCASSSLAPMTFAEPRYPERSVRAIVPFPAGGGTDIFARLVAQRLSERLGQTFVIENIPGAGGNAGTGQAAKAAPDGHTILFAFGSFAVNPSLYAKVPYDPYRDFEPVTLAVSTATVVVVHPSITARSLPELAEQIRNNPGKHSFGSGGFGTQAHLAGEQIRLAYGIDLAHVPFQGAGPSVASVVGGHTPIVLTSLAAGIEQIRSGQIRALAVTSPRRASELPEVPTMTEIGQPAIIGDSWVGVLVPAGTSRHIVDILHREISGILALPETKARLVTLGYEPIMSTPKEFEHSIKVETETWAKIIKAANIKVQ